jgi:antitoxin YefM
MFMKTSLATEVRKNWSRFLDTVVREKPQAVQRNRDLAFVIALPHLEEILKHYRFTLEYELEEDGSYTGTLKEIDLVGNAKSIDELKMKLAKDLLEYAQDYMNEFTLYFHAPNRKDHFPYVLHVLIKNSVEEVVDLIDGDLERT